MATVPASGETANPDVPDTSAPVIEDGRSLPVSAVEGGEALPGVDTDVAALAAIDVRDLDWAAIREATYPAALRARMRLIVEQLEALLDSEAGLGMLFDSDRADPDDRAIQITLPADDDSAIWIIGDLHGDLLALETALAQIHQHACSNDSAATPIPRIIFLGDFFDDEGFGLELLLRVFELIVAMPGRIAIVAGNHDEALTYDGARFASTVSPSDFADFLNANLAHEWIGRAGKLAVRMVNRAPRALFFPDGLLIAHGGFPLKDLHPALEQSGNWNDPACLSDFIWVRAHPKARRKMPNRFSRGSQFGFEDFADFCALSARLGRPVTRMVRGHDHVEARYAIYPAYQAHPVLTTVALSRRLPREQFGPHERAPTIARVLEGQLPQVYQLHIPFDMIDQLFPPPQGTPDASEEDALS
jgi:hypothetical protein